LQILNDGVPGCEFARSSGRTETNRIHCNLAIIVDEVSVPATVFALSLPKIAAGTGGVLDLLLFSHRCRVAPARRNVKQKN